VLAGQLAEHEAVEHDQDPCHHEQRPGQDGGAQEAGARSLARRVRPHEPPAAGAGATGGRRRSTAARTTATAPGTTASPACATAATRRALPRRLGSRRRSPRVVLRGNSRGGCANFGIFVIRHY